MESPSDADLEPGAQALILFDQLIGLFVDSSLVSVERRAETIVVTPRDPGTFPVTLYDQGEDAMIAAERWHAHYDDPEQAAFAALWLLTPYYRVVHELRGGILAAVWIERWEVAGWDAMEPVYFLNPEYAPDWDPAAGHAFHRRTFQQAIAVPPQPYEVVVPGARLDASHLPEDSELGVHVHPIDFPLGPLLLRE